MSSLVLNSEIVRVLVDRLNVLKGIILDFQTKYFFLVSFHFLL